MKTLSVVCPVYNEEEVISLFYAELGRVLDTLSGRYHCEMIFVVDRCRDRTPEILRAIAARDPRVRVILLSTRFGQQMSLLAGLEHAHSDAVVMLDSDLQHPPSLIPKLLEEFEKGYDVVYTIRKSIRELGFFKRLTSRLFYRTLKYLSDTEIHESAADFRLISRRVCAVFQTQIRERNQFLRGLVAWVGYRQTGVEFTVQERPKGETKYPLKRLLTFATHGIVSFSKRPLIGAGLVGLGFALFGFALTAMTLFEYFLLARPPSGWTTLVIIISVFNGVTLIFLGVIGQYVAAIFDEVKARPHYLIDEKIGFAEEAQGIAR